MKNGLFIPLFEKKRSVPLFEKDDCTGRDLLLQSLHSRHPWRSCRRYEPKEGRGRSRREHAIEGNAGAIADDCREAGGRQCRSYIAEGPGEIY
jgi:hypothetical protein